MNIIALCMLSAIIFGCSVNADFGLFSSLFGGQRSSGNCCSSGCATGSACCHTQQVSCCTYYYCSCGRKKRSVGEDGKEGLVDVTDEVEDKRCNHVGLRSVLEQNISGDPDESKEAISERASQVLGGKYAVICSKGDFTYIAYSQHYCLLSKHGVQCYAFRL